MNVGFCPKCPFHGRPLSLLTSKASKGLVREPGPGTVLSTRQPPLRCLLSWKPTRRDCNQGPPPALSGFDGFGQGEALAGHQRWGGDRGDSEAFLLPPCFPAEFPAVATFCGGSSSGVASLLDSSCHW